MVMRTYFLILIDLSNADVSLFHKSITIEDIWT